MHEEPLVLYFYEISSNRSVHRDRNLINFNESDSMLSDRRFCSIRTSHKQRPVSEARENISPRR